MNGVSVVTASGSVLGDTAGNDFEFRISNFELGEELCNGVGCTDGTMEGEELENHEG